MATLAIVALIIAFVCMFGMFFSQRNETVFTGFMVIEIVSAIVFVFALGGVYAVM